MQNNDFVFSRRIDGHTIRGSAWYEELEDGWYVKVIASNGQIDQRGPVNDFLLELQDMLALAIQTSRKAA